MTGDRLTDTSFWARYQAGVQLRNQWVHGPLGVYSKEDPEGAEEFILAVLDLIRHVETTLKRSGVKPAPERFRVEQHHTPRAIDVTAHLLWPEESAIRITIRQTEGEPDER